jgi:uncharacterized repeat protein (TIGR01451 family)
MNNSITAMKSPKISAKNCRVATLFASLLAGVLLQFPSSATAQSSDLAIAIYNTPLDVYVNDYMPYTMYVTNLGPGSVTNVIVTHTLAFGSFLIDASPTPAVTNTDLYFNLGTLTNLAVRKIVVRARPAYAISYSCSATVNSAVNSDPNSANNTANLNFVARNYLSGNLTASVVSSQTYDPQFGYLDQWIQLSNNGSSPVASTRIVVSGLTTNWLANAAGTNNGNPFIIYPAILNPGQSVNMLLQFFARNYFSFSNSQMQAFATPIENLTPPANLGTPAPNIGEWQISSAVPGSVLIEFNSITNQSYTVLYSDNPKMANAVMALPSITAQANKTFWQDYGPPATASFPTNTTPRYYRVYLNP